MPEEGSPRLRGSTTRELLEELMLRSEAIEHERHRVFLHYSADSLLDNLTSAELVARRLEPGELTT